MTGLALAFALAATPDPQMASDQAVVEALFEAFNSRDMAAMEALYAADAVLMSSDFCAPRGRADLRRTYAPLFEGHPDVRDEVRQIVISGDRAAVQFDAVADAVEQPLRLRLAIFFKFRDGLVIEDDTIFDTGWAPCRS